MIWARQFCGSEQTGWCPPWYFWYFQVQSLTLVAWRHWDYFWPNRFSIYVPNQFRFLNYSNVRNFKTIKNWFEHQFVVLNKTIKSIQNIHGQKSLKMKLVLLVINSAIATFSGKWTLKYWGSNIKISNLVTGWHTLERSTLYVKLLVTLMWDPPKLLIFQISSLQKVVMNLPKINSHLSDIIGNISLPVLTALMAHNLWIAWLSSKSFLRSISTKITNFRKLKECFVQYFLVVQMRLLWGSKGHLGSFWQFLAIFVKPKKRASAPSRGRI